MANVKISELPNATSLNSGDSFPVVQGGVTKQAARSVLFASPTFTGTTTAAILTATGDVTFDGGAFVFNESGADKDARFEGDTDANLLFLDASTDRVGIGTATPAAKLDVNGNTSVTGNVSLTGSVVLANDQYLYWGAGDGSAYVRGNSSSDYISFGTVGVERMRLDASGNLGIGTTSPATKLDVDGEAIVRGLLTSADAIKLGGNTSAPSPADAFIYRPADNTLAFGTASNERMRLDSSGNVGIGTTSPTYRLDVSAAGTSVSSAFRSDQSEAWMLLKDSGTTLGHVRLGSASGAMLFYSGNSEKMRITAAGDLIHQVNGTAPTLSTNSTMSFELTSNTSLKIVVRGTDGTTRSVSLTLA